MKDRYQNRAKQAAYENAYDCFYFGMGSADWNDCGIDPELRPEVWRLAFWDCAEPDYEHGDMKNDIYVFWPLYA